MWFPTPREGGDSIGPDRADVWPAREGRYRDGGIAVAPGAGRHVRGKGEHGKKTSAHHRG
jgi:hypothetical protein